MKYREILYKPLTVALVALFIFSSLLSGCEKHDVSISHSTNDTILYYPENILEKDLPDYRLDIVHFWHECLESYFIGEALMEILHEYYQDEVSRGLITYRRIRSQYLENSEIVFNYKAMTEDFVTHLIAPDINEMKNHHFLWYIAEDEERLHQYLKDMLQNMIGKL